MRYQAVGGWRRYRCGVALVALCVLPMVVGCTSSEDSDARVRSDTTIDEVSPDRSTSTTSAPHDCASLEAVLAAPGSVVGPEHEQVRPDLGELPPAVSEALETLLDERDEYVAQLKDLDLPAVDGDTDALAGLNGRLDTPASQDARETLESYLSDCSE